MDFLLNGHFAHLSSFFFSFLLSLVFFCSFFAFTQFLLVCIHGRENPELRFFPPILRWRYNRFGMFDVCADTTECAVWHGEINGARLRSEPHYEHPRLSVSFFLLSFSFFFFGREICLSPMNLNVKHFLSLSLSFSSSAASLHINTVFMGFAWSN